MFPGMTNTRVRTAIKTRFRAGGVEGSGTIQNVSAEGLFVSTGFVPEQGESVLLVLPGEGGRVLAVSGMVWWTTSARSAKPGFGLRLLEGNQQFQQLVASLR
jgi:Tfp pilus assembly protein PilZ